MLKDPREFLQRLRVRDVRASSFRFINIPAWLQDFQDKLLFGGAFFVSKLLLGMKRQEKLTRMCNCVLKASEPC